METDNCRWPDTALTEVGPGVIDMLMSLEQLSQQHAATFAGLNAYAVATRRLGEFGTALPRYEQTLKATARHPQAPLSGLRETQRLRCVLKATERLGSGLLVVDPASRGRAVAHSNNRLNQFGKKAVSFGTSALAVWAAYKLTMFWVSFLVSPPDDPEQHSHTPRMYYQEMEAVRRVVRAEVTVVSI